MDIFKGVMRIETVEGSVRGLWGVVVSSFLEVVGGVGSSVKEDLVRGVSVSEEDKEVTAATGAVSSMVLATTWWWRFR